MTGPNRRNTWLAATLLLGSMLAAIAWLWPASPRRGEAERDTPASPAGTARTPAMPAARLRTPPARAPHAADDTTGDATRTLADLSAQFATQPRDLRWAVPAESAVADAMERALAATGTRQSPLVSVECRSSACRMQLAGNNEVDAETAAQWLLLELAGELPRARVVTVQDAGLAPVTYVFASR